MTAPTPATTTRNLASTDPAVNALISLLPGDPLTTRQLADAVGWNPRTAKTELGKLERGRLVQSTAVLDGRKRTVVWTLTRDGGQYALETAKQSGRLATLAPPPAEPVDPSPTEPQAIAETPTAQHPDPNGPWPSLQAAAGPVDAERQLTATLGPWIYVLRAARHGIGEGRAADRRIVETHLTAIETQLGVTWLGGDYHLDDGTIVNPARLDFLATAQWAALTADTTNADH